MVIQPQAYPQDPMLDSKKKEFEEKVEFSIHFQITNLDQTYAKVHKWPHVRIR